MSYLQVLIYKQTQYQATDGYTGPASAHGCSSCQNITKNMQISDEKPNQVLVVRKPRVPPEGY